MSAHSGRNINYVLISKERDICLLYNAMRIYSLISVVHFLQTVCEYSHQDMVII